MRKIVLLGIMGSLGIVSAADARDRKPVDPNKVICRSEDVIGSRLQTSKRCLTALQWDQLQREQRETVDRVQTLRVHNGS